MRPRRRFFVYFGGWLTPARPRGRPTDHIGRWPVLQVLAAILLLFRGLVFSQDAKSHTDYALFFATNEYDDWPILKNPIPDAVEIKNEMEENYNFKTELVRNATRERIAGKLGEYSKKHYGSG